MGVGVAATGSSGEGRDGDGDDRDGDGRPRRGTRTAATQTKKKVIGFCFWVVVPDFCENAPARAAGEGRSSISFHLQRVFVARANFFL